MPHHQPAQLKAQPSHSNYIHHLQKKWFIPGMYACIMNYTYVYIHNLHNCNHFDSIIGSKAFEQLSDVVSSKHLLADIKKLSPSKQTSSLESYHSVLNHFAPKLLAFSYVGMHCR